MYVREKFEDFKMQVFPKWEDTLLVNLNTVNSGSSDTVNVILLGYRNNKHISVSQVCWDIPRSHSNASPKNHSHLVCGPQLLLVKSMGKL